MAEVGFPGQHTTTTTVTSNTVVQTNLRFDPLYLKTIPGILKLIQVVSSLVGFICIQASWLSYLGKSVYFSWVAMIAFWFTGILLGLYLFHMVEKFYKIPWLKIELGFCAVWTFLYLLAAILAVTVHSDAHSAAAFFGFVAMFAYAADAYLKWRAARAGGLAQGTRVVSKQTTSVEAPPREAY
ncbi:CKLF-like MARVEL transmembrane domain-containing protein 4 [Ostrinia furnacalis]|uniref:CKLF-like MARVEL transmembrane domain-containing protein 4 n=1 Tax=Ostrinia furnacalis TaxID=93504 RepID=UPI001039E73F|nr:CKLF-like MARVEL transmembrane domain-containing protein 4 [Ostrinia furnacalis]XP_028173347.1 CKLF-like MARVEL transmembrane domain-containing protein 4 [Ostrinia furnacalis]XP_028173348.1 CKLF-like MARVEL transmembrane domain-containing protein 4 [Ostrinia furnacalis]